MNVSAAGEEIEKLWTTSHSYTFRLESNRHSQLQTVTGQNDSDGPLTQTTQ